MSFLCKNEPCPAREYELSLKTAELETAHEKSLARLRSLVNQEETRISRVECIILRANHEILQARCERSNYDIEQLLQAEAALKLQLLQAQDDLATLQLSTRTDSRAMQDLKNDIVTMKRKVLDSEKLSTENLNLTKELSHMKQDVERLRTQTKSNQALIAEKSALERQLNSLEVQIEEERRAFERNLTSNNKTQNGDVQKQLKKLQEDLQREINERLRVEQEAHEKSIAWEAQKKSLEDRLQTLRKQLRSTKEKLKEHQIDARISQGAQKDDQPRQSNASDRGTSIGYAGATFDPSMTIATPGAVKTVKNHRPSVTLGEKSSFSITPYLKRNRNADSPPNDSDDDLPIQAESHLGGKRTKLSPKSDVVQKSESSYRGQTEEEGSDVYDGSEPAGLDDDKPLLPEGSVLSRKQSILDSKTKRESSMDSKQAQRKRKVLGAQRELTLFEEEDEELQRPKKVEKLIPNLKPSSKRPQTLGLARRAFGETSTFSPLKREKKLI